MTTNVKEEISSRDVTMSEPGDAGPKLFPSQGSKAVFVSYMFMFVAQGMLVTGSRHGAATYAYNTVTVVLLTEVLKLVMSSLLYMKE